MTPSDIELLSTLHDRTGRLESSVNGNFIAKSLHDRTGRLESSLSACRETDCLHDRTGRLENSGIKKQRY